MCPRNHTLVTHAMCERVPKMQEADALLKEGGLEIEIVVFDFSDTWGHFRKDSCGGRRLIWMGQ